MPKRASLLTRPLPGLFLLLATACGGSAAEVAPPSYVPSEDAPPTVSIRTPTAGATLSGLVAVTIDAHDDRQVLGIVCTLDGSPIASEDTQAPYEVVLDAARHPDGDHVLRATARDDLGQTDTDEITVTIANDPTARILMTWSDIEAGLVGTFSVPAAEEPGTDYRFGYSNAVHAQLANGRLLVMGHPWYPMQAEIALPDTLDGSEATRVGDWFDFTHGTLPTGWEDGAPAYVLGGLLEIGDRLHFTKHQWYDGAGTDWETQGYRTGGTIHGPWKVDGSHAHHSRVGGYMSRAPLAVRAAGFTYLAGLEGTSGAALGRWGPNLFAIEVDDTIPRGGSLPSRPLICHDTEEHAPAGWWIGDKVTAVVWIETPTHHAVLMLLHQKLGDTWYGEADVGGDPYGGGKGYHAEGYVLKAWIYHPDDLLAVYRGERDPWALEPAEETILTERQPLSDSETYHSVFTGRAIDELQLSLRDGRLIVLQPDGYRPGLYEGMPKGYVFQLD